jgi:uncharacterized Zn finger protein
MDATIKLRQRCESQKRQLRQLKAELRDIPKCDRLLAEGRVRVLSANSVGILADVTGSHGVYRVMVYLDAQDRHIRTCTCENAQYHPIHPACHHVRAVEKIWRP